MIKIKKLKFDVDSSHGLAAVDIEIEFEVCGIPEDWKLEFLELPLINAPCPESFDKAIRYHIEEEFMRWFHEDRPFEGYSSEYV